MIGQLPFINMCTFPFELWIMLYSVVAKISIVIKKGSMGNAKTVLTKWFIQRILLLLLKNTHTHTHIYNMYKFPPVLLLSSFIINKVFVCKYTCWYRSRLFFSHFVTSSVAYKGHLCLLKSYSQNTVEKYMYFRYYNLLKYDSIPPIECL